jgi:phytanoyl-CoA hydroxylase
MPLHTLSQGQLTSFRVDGFLTVENVLTDDEVDSLAARSDLIASGQAEHIPQQCIQQEQVFRKGEREVADQVLSVRKLHMLAVHDEVMWQHATNPRMVDIIADLLGTDDIKLYNDQLFMKAPETGTAQGWHQDSGSWRDIFPMDLVSAWTAIDDATLENGCLNFAAGTHRWGMLSTFARQALVDELDNGEWPVKPVPLKRGSVSFHHSLTLHHSRATSVKDEAVTDAPKVPPFKQVRGRSFPGCV